MLQCRDISFCSEILFQNIPVCLSIFVMDKLTVCSPFFGAIPTERIHKVTKEVNVQKFPSRNKPSETNGNRTRDCPNSSEAS